MQHCDALIGQTDTHLYIGDGQGALDALDHNWSALRRSNLLRVGFYRVMITVLRGRAKVAIASTAANRERRKLLQSALRDALKLIKLHQNWAVGFGNLLRAGICSVDNNFEEAERYLNLSTKEFAAAKMDQYLAVVRRRLRQLRPEMKADGGNENSWIIDQGVVNPERIADMLAPGAWIPRT
jgi:hypothetical protein